MTEARRMRGVCAVLGAFMLALPARAENGIYLLGVLAWARQQSGRRRQAEVCSR